MNVLIVDDDLAFAKSLARVLGRLGHAVQLASSLEHALRLLATRHPSLLLTDISQGETWDGIDLACWAANAYGMPVIAMTNGDHAQAHARLLGAGLAGIAILPKPVSLEALIEQLAWNDNGTPSAAAARGN